MEFTVNTPARATAGVTHECLCVAVEALVAVLSYRVKLQLVMEDAERKKWETLLQKNWRGRDPLMCVHARKHHLLTKGLFKINSGL